MSSTLSGHAGNLSTPNQEALSAFKQQITAANLYIPETDMELASHDDATLLRFLRARKFDLPSTQKQFASAEEWRKKHDVDRLFATAATEEVEAARSFYPMWTGRRDKNGVPLYVYRLASLKKRDAELNSLTPERRYQRIVILYETMWRFTMRLCSVLPRPNPHIPISSTTSIIDLEGVSMNMLWNFRTHLQTAATLATANFPETLHMVVVVNAPSYFSTAWGWAKGWFDEHTRSKIHVFSKDTQASKLAELAHPKDIPRCYGGQLDWEFGNNPALDDEAKAILGEAYPLGAWEFDEVTRKKVRPREDGKRVKTGPVDLGEAEGAEKDGVVANGAAHGGEGTVQQAHEGSGAGAEQTTAVNGDAHGVAPPIGDAPVPGPAQPKTVLVAPTEDTAASTQGTEPLAELGSAQTTDTNAILGSRVT